MSRTSWPHRACAAARCAIGTVALWGAGCSPSASAAAFETPWTFVTVAFAASCAAFYAWGRARSGQHPARDDESGAEARRSEPLPQPQTPPAIAKPKAAPAVPACTAEAAALVQAMEGATVLAGRGPAGWVVLGFNATARQLWTDATAGMPLHMLAGVPADGRAAMDQLAPGHALSFDGWRFALLAEDAATRRALVTQVANAAREADLFGSTLTHDLRAPIRVVEGFTRIVKEDYGRYLDRVGNEHLDRVLGAAHRMNLMIDALLTMARLSAQPLARRPIDLSQLAQFVVEDFERASPQRQVAMEIEPGLGTSGDPTLLRLVLENLLGNAWKYTARTEAARIVLRSTLHLGQPAFVVSDNGAGFDMRSADRLFGLFQRLHSANDFPGHGVGLASVRRIVRRHGGEIWAEGSPGRGATFTFTLG